VRCLGIGLLILSLGHTPLPKADYHNIRHHDGPGQVCRLHEHLLLWHPNAGLADDVAILHWHWFLPMAGGPGSNTDSQSPALHGCVPDWSGLTWENVPQLATDARPRFIGRLALGPAEMNLPAFDVAMETVSGQPDLPLVHAFSATFAPRIPLSALLQRWVC
jgi:hypothetical protein